jgi:cysteine desulfurase
MSQLPIHYFDNNATTRVAPEVVEAMLPFLTEHWGNPSSAYSFGRNLAVAIDTAREQVAALLNAEPREVIFTSCGTESINTAIQSALLTQPEKRHIVTTAVEHSATMKFCELRQKHGATVTFLPVSPEGALDPQLLEKSIRPDTAIVSIMWANNETGVLFPVEDIAALCRQKGVLFHTDAVQVPGKLKIDARALGVDFLSLSAHKLHAPKGVGALFVKRRTKFQPYVVGGGQERGRRGGTENVAGIVAFGRAAELAKARREDEVLRMRRLRDKLEKGVLSRIPDTRLNGPKEPRLVNTTNLAFGGVEAEGILMLLDQAGICASSGSACTTGSLDPSHVLTAMGFDAARARSSIRFSLSGYTTEAEVDHLLNQLPGIIAKLRASSPDAASGSLAPPAQTS